MNQPSAPAQNWNICNNNNNNNNMTSISNILSVHHSEVLLPWVNTTPNKGKEEEEEEIIQLWYISYSEGPLT